MLSSRAHEPGSEAFHTKKQLVDGVLEEEESHSQEVLGEEDRQEDGEEDRQEDGREKRGAEVDREEPVEEAHREEVNSEENDLAKDGRHEARGKEGNREEDDGKEAEDCEEGCFRPLDGIGSQCGTRPPSACDGGLVLRHHPR